MSTEIQNIIIPSENSPALDWTEYFKILKFKFGKTNAKVLFLKTWQINGNTSLSYDTDFVNYFKKYDIDLSSTYLDIKTSLLELGDTILNLPKKIVAIALIPTFLIISIGIAIPTYLIIKNKK